MQKSWYTFQEIIKSYFQLLGCNANTNVTVNGIRTEHDIDVLVKSKYLGHEVTWIIEVKKWSKRVSKLHVLALRQIVDDVGADRGFIISEKGFQKGAIEATKNTNIYLLTYKQLQEFSESTIQTDILKKYVERLSLLINRYYANPKNLRIKYNLRGDAGENIQDFNAYFIMLSLIRAIREGVNNRYPINFETHLNEKYGDSIAENYFQLINWLNINFLAVEEKIFLAEIRMQENKEYNPTLIFREKFLNHFNI